MIVQAFILAFNDLHPDYLKTLQVHMKPTITAVDGHLSTSDGDTKQRQDWLIGTKCTIADLSFVVWDMPQVLNVCFRGDEEVDTVEKRLSKWPKWARWHESIESVSGVKDFLEDAEALRGF